MSRTFALRFVTLAFTCLLLLRCPLTPQDQGLAFLNPLLDGHAKWINYAPTHFDPPHGQFPSLSEIRADLQQLSDEGYDGVITYGIDSTLAEAPRLAKEAGIAVVGVGIWNIKDKDSIDRAVDLAPYADFYVVGSEGLFRAGARDAYTVGELIDALEEVRRRTGRPVTTAEPWDTFIDHVELVHEVDFVCVNAYGWWQGNHDPVSAAQVTVELYDKVGAAAAEESAIGKTTPRPIIVRETGFPTGGHPDASVTKQHLYFAALRTMDVPFVYFEAYDQPWKAEEDNDYDIGPHWGLHDHEGVLKEGEPALAFTRVPPLGSEHDLEGVAVDVDRLNYRVVVYIKVFGEYWVKPTLADPYTAIGEDGRWTVDITTGGPEGHDQDATEIRAYIVQRRFVPDLHELPSQHVASATVMRIKNSAS